MCSDPWRSWLFPMWNAEKWLYRFKLRPLWVSQCSKHSISFFQNLIFAVNVFFILHNHFLPHWWYNNVFAVLFFSVLMYYFVLLRGGRLRFRLIQQVWLSLESLACTSSDFKILILAPVVFSLMNMLINQRDWKPDMIRKMHNKYIYIDLFMCVCVW